MRSPSSSTAARQRSSATDARRPPIRSAKTIALKSIRLAGDAEGPRLVYRGLFGSGHADLRPARRLSAAAVLRVLTVPVAWRLAKAYIPWPRQLHEASGGRRLHEGAAQQPRSAGCRWGGHDLPIRGACARATGQWKSRANAARHHSFSADHLSRGRRGPVDVPFQPRLWAADERDERDRAGRLGA